MNVPTTISLLFFLFFFSSDGSPTLLSPSRRILHQPFFPLDSSPPSPPSSPTSDQLPFSGGNSNQPFFPTDNSPPPPATASPFASFPANISSLNVPHPLSSKPASNKLVAVTVSLSLSAVAIAAVALFLYFRGRRNRAFNNGDDKTSRSETTAASSTVYRFNVPPAPAPPLRKPSNNSSEFLYLGTLVNSGAIDGPSVAGGGGGGVDSGGGRRSAGTRKLRSPDLFPLPAIISRQQIQQVEDEDQEEFYSPRGSASGRESGSGSRRAFEAVVRAQQAQAEQLINGGRGNAHSDDSTSSSSSDRKSVV